MLPIIKWRKVWFSLSGTLVAIGLLGFVSLGLRLGTDFTGGSLLEFDFKDSRPSLDEINNKISSGGISGFNVQPVSEKGILIRAPEMPEDMHQKLLQSLSGLGEEKRFESIGPTIGQELRRTTFYAILIVVTFILLYVSWAFRKVRRYGKITAWTYGISTVVALFHDIAILTGVFVFLGYFLKVEIDTSFVAALLTTLGYSVNDTIVVFDRIRENLTKSKENESFTLIAEKSVNETLARSFSTSFTAILTLFSIFLFGGASIRYFVLALIIGITAGTYSSIFLASPLLVWWERKNS